MRMRQSGRMPQATVRPQRPPLCPLDLDWTSTEFTSVHSDIGAGGRRVIRAVEETSGPAELGRVTVLCSYHLALFESLPRKN